MEGLFEAAAANRAEREPWLALAAELKRRGDVRGELADLQLALEDARGAERHALMLAEEKLLRDRAAELWGPLAGIAPGLTADWRRGFLDSLVVPGVSLISQRSGELLREELLPRELLSRVVDHDVARLCRYLYAGRKPKRAPPWIERLDLAQAVVTSDLMRLPKLRALRVAVLVASAALRHPTLEHVTLPATGPFLDVLEDAALPALKSLALTGLDAAGPEPARVVRALTALGPERVYLSLGGRRASAPWTADAVRAIEPVTDRIAGLGLVHDLGDSPPSWERGDAPRGPEGGRSRLLGPIGVELRRRVERARRPRAGVSQIRRRRAGRAMARRGPSRASPAHPQAAAQPAVVVWLLDHPRCPPS